jgi:predicted Rossmann fold nucleotide-binding protein DprA/Smf involved in DNA uptake
VLQVTSLQSDHPDYPKAATQYWADSALPTISAIGNPKLLQQPTLAIFCSVKCPGDLILQTYDLARNLRDTKISTISGFHSPMEKECLMLLLRGTQPIVHCPARSLDKMRLPKEHKTAIQSDHLLILSPFHSNQSRMTAMLAQKRNYFVAALADAVFIAYASPDSKTEDLAKQVVAWKKPLLTFTSNDNQNLMNLGAKAIEAFLNNNFEFKVLPGK